MDKKKIPLETIMQFPTSMLIRLINKAKNYLKHDDIWIELCKSYNESPNIIDIIPTMWDDLNVSAKTDHGIVILNYKLLCDGDFFKDFSYLIHEYDHWFQQCYGEKPTQSSDDGNYLENPYEQDAFQIQVEYIADHFGKEDAENYVNKLLDYHEVDNKKDHDNLEDVLMEKI
jgi:hypothetical protein